MPLPPDFSVGGTDDVARNPGKHSKGRQQEAGVGAHCYIKSYVVQPPGFIPDPLVTRVGWWP